MANTTFIDALEIVRNGENITISRDILSDAGSDDFCAHVVTRSWTMKYEDVISCEDIETYVDMMDITGYGKPNSRYYYECYQKGRYGGRNVDEYKKMNTLSDERERIEILRNYIKNNF